MITRCFPLVNIPPSSPPRTWVPPRNENALAVTESGIANPAVLVCAGGGSKSAREGRSDAVRSGASVGILGGASVGAAAKQRRPTNFPVNRERPATGTLKQTPTRLPGYGWAFAATTCPCRTFHMSDEPRPASSDEPNPYASSQTASEPSSSSSLDLPAWIALGCCLISLGLWLLALIVSLPYGSPNAPPLIEILGFTVMFMVFPTLGLAGAVSMLTRRRYGLCVASACGMMVPILGPCFGITLPLGIWAFVLLRRRPIRESFVIIEQSQG